VPLFSAGIAWLGLVVVYAGFLSIGFVFHLIPPILPVVIGDLQISHGQAGLLMSLFALPGILFSLPAGWLVDRFGAQATGVAGLAIMGAGTLAMGLGQGFVWILAARALAGVGAMVGVVSMQRMVTRLFAGRSLGIPMGVSGSAIPIGIIIVLNTMGPVAVEKGWRASTTYAGWTVLVVAMAFWTAGLLLGLASRRHLAASGTRTESGASRPSVTPEIGSPGQLEVKDGLRAIWIASIVWFCTNGAMTSFMTFAPDHFLDLGFALKERGVFTSIPMWVSASLGPVTGWITDRWGGRAAFIAAGMGLLALGLVLVPVSGLSPVLIGLALGTALALVVTPLLSMVGDVLPPSHHGRGFGILSTSANLGVFVVPPVAGAVRDSSGHYGWTFTLLAAVAALGVAGAEVLRRRRYCTPFGAR